MRWEGDLFEVIEAEPCGAGMRYRLALWEDRHTVRVVEAYERASEEARWAEQANRRAAVRIRRWSLLLAPVLGHLPGSVQKRMEGEFGVPARAMTIASALPLFTLGVLGLLATQIAAFGGGAVLLPWLASRPYLAIYLFAESALRLFVAFLQEEPAGSLIGVILYEAWKQWRTPRGAGGERPLPERPMEPRPAWKPGDSYRMLEPLLSLLSPGEQAILEERFGFDPRKWGRLGAAAISVVALSNVAVSLLRLAGGIDSVWDLLWLLAGGYFLAEQVHRWRELAKDRPAGSALGALVRPIAKGLFQDGRPAERG